MGECTLAKTKQPTPTEQNPNRACRGIESARDDMGLVEGETVLCPLPNSRPGSSGEASCFLIFVQRNAHRSVHVLALHLLGNLVDLHDVSFFGRTNEYALRLTSWAFHCWLPFVFDCQLCSFRATLDGRHGFQEKLWMLLRIAQCASASNVGRLQLAPLHFISALDLFDPAFVLILRPW